MTFMQSCKRQFRKPQISYIFQTQLCIHCMIAYHHVLFQIYNCKFFECTAGTVARVHSKKSTHYSYITTTWQACINSETSEIRVFQKFIETVKRDLTRVSEQMS